MSKYSQLLPISVQICTLNELENISDLIRSIKNNNPAEILIIDGGSSDGTVEKALSLGVTVIEVGRIGLAGQRQIGIENTIQPYIAIVDADDRIEQNFLITLLNQMNELCLDAIDGITKPLVLNSYWQRGWANGIYDERSDVILTNMVGRPALYKRSAILDVGFDQMFKYGSEDTDLSYSFELKGYSQAHGTGINYRIHEDKFLSSIKKWIAYGRGYARFSVKYPEKKKNMLWHIFLNLPLLRVIKKYPESLPFIPFYFLYSLFCAAGFYLEYQSLFINKLIAILRK